MATSTYMTFLMHKNASNWEKLIDIKDYPDLGSDPEMIDTTTLSNRMKTAILGIYDNGGLEFNANYDHAEYVAIKALERKDEEYAIWLGGTEEADGTAKPTGVEGKFSFGGQLSIRVKGGGVNAVREMSIKIAPSTIIKEG